MNNDFIINFFDANGNLKEKEDFFAEIDAVYDELQKEGNEQKENEGDFFEQMLNTEIPIDVLPSFNFLKRTIVIDDEITNETASNCLNKIRFWNTADEFNNIPIDERNPIKVYLNTPGGDLYSTFAIVDAIKLSKTPVYTITYGTAYSGGFFIGIAGHKRYGYNLSSFMFHEGATGYIADCHKFAQYSEQYSKEREKIKQLVINNTKITEELYKEHRKDDWYFNIEDALEYGVVDEISENLI